MTSVNHLLLVDLINNAKATKDAKNRLFQLEQIREIVFFRETSLLADFVSDIFSFMIDKSTIIRRFLVKFAGEVFDNNVSLGLSHILECFHYFLADSNDTIVKEIVRIMTRLYSKLLQTLCHSSMSNSSVSEVKPQYTSFKGIIARLNDVIGTSRSDDLKELCFRLLEEEILFGIPATTTTVDPRLNRRLNDPRLARSAAASSSSGKDTASSSSSSSSFSIEDIPPHHPLLSKTDIQKEAEDYFSKLLLWCSKGGASGSGSSASFSPHLMAVLANVIATVGSTRPTLSLNCAHTLTSLINGKGATSSISAMSKEDRENVVRAAHRLLRATNIFGSDPEGQMQKLKSAISILESSTSNVEGGEAGLSGLKRSHAVANDEDEDDAPEVKRARIIAALNDAQLVKQSQVQQTPQTSSQEGHLSSSGVGIPALSSLPNKQQVEAITTSKDIHFSHSVSQGEFTELASDLLAPPSSASASNSGVDPSFVFVDNSTSTGETVCVPRILSDGNKGGFLDCSLFVISKILEQSIDNQVCFSCIFHCSFYARFFLESRIS
jgi:hypothetical protein